MIKFNGGESVITDSPLCIGISGFSVSLIRLPTRSLRVETATFSSMSRIRTLTVWRFSFPMAICFPQPGAECSAQFDGLPP